MKNFLEKTLKDMFMVNDYDNGVCVINSNLFSPKDDDDYAIGVKKSNDKYILSDMSLTYNRLEQRNGLLNDNIYCEIIADGIHVSKNMLKLFFKVKDKTKIIMISDSLPAAHLDKEIIFCNKKILPSGKDSNGTIAGSVMFLDEIADYVAKNNIATAEEINNFVFKNPLEHLNLDKNELKYIENLA